MSIGENIRHLRKEKGWTQAQLAEKLSVSQQMIGQFENSKKPPKIETVEKIAMALEVSMVDLMGYDYWDQKLNPNGKLTKEVEQEEGFKLYLQSLGYTVKAYPEGNSEEGASSCTYQITGNGLDVSLLQEEYKQLQSSSSDLVFSYIWKKQQQK